MNLRWAFWFLLCNLLLFWALGFRYLSQMPFQSNLGISFGIVTVFSHFFLLATLSFVAPVLVSFLITNDFYYRSIISTYYTLLISILAFDQAAFTVFHEHLRWHNLVALLQMNQRYQIDLINAYFLAIPFLLLFEVIFGSFIWRRIFHLRMRSKFSYIFFFIMGICVCWSNSLYLYALNTHNEEILHFRSMFPLMFYFTPSFN